MQFTLGNLFSAQELVEDKLGDVEAFWLQSEFSMNINYPFEEEGSGSVTEFSLNF